MKAINPPDANIPGISQAMLVEEGRLLLLSGHVPFESEGQLVTNDLAAQLRQAFVNMQATLEAAGADFSNVARITLFVRDYDASKLDAIRQVRDEFVNRETPPASALIGVAQLFHPDVLVEIDAVAVLSE